MKLKIDTGLRKVADNVWNTPAFHNIDNDKVRLYEDGGYNVPRVTALLDTIKEDYIIKWANSLGWKRQSYTKVLQEAADIGTEVHHEIEMFLKHGDMGMTPGFLSFYEWWNNFLSNNTISDLRSEVSMSCPYFAGTTDLFFTANGCNCLMDFKTSKHIGYKYLMQLAAYTYMMNITYGKSIDYCIIFQIDKYEPGLYKVYMYNLNNKETKELFDYALQYMIHLSCGYAYNQYIQSKFNEVTGIYTSPWYQDGGTIEHDI